MKLVSEILFPLFGALGYISLGLSYEPELEEYRKIFIKCCLTCFILFAIFFILFIVSVI